MAPSINHVLKVEQFLHGYRDGHRLLASSVVLDEFSALEMTRMSDLMSENISGISSYYSGYPLKSARKYIISKTWAAPEMHRPGCVWTQSYMLDYSAVAKLNNISRLFESFCRPVGSNFDIYKSPVFLSNLPDQYVSIYKSNQYGDDSIRIFNCIAGLYGVKNERIGISSSGIQEKDDFLIEGVWNQMPPRLRRDFVFCTSASMRSITPDAAVTLFISTEISNFEIGFPALSKNEMTAVQLLTDDIVKDNKADLRGFIARYITDAKEVRKAVLDLVNVANDLFKYPPDIGISAAASKIARYFPASGNCDLIKRDFISASFLNKSHFSEAERLRFIVSDILPELCSVEWLKSSDEVTNLVSRLAIEGPPMVRRLFDICLDAPADSLGNELFKIACQSLDEEFLANIYAPAEIKLRMAAFNPQLLNLRTYWGTFETLPRDDDWGLLSNNGDLGRAVIAMIGAGRFDTIRNLISRDKVFYLRSVVEHLNDIASPALANVLVELRSFRAEIVGMLLEWGGLSVNVIDAVLQDVFDEPHPAVNAEYWAAMLAGPELKEMYAGMSVTSYFVLFDVAPSALSHETSMQLLGISFESLLQGLMKEDFFAQRTREKIRRKYVRDSHSPDDIAGRIRKRLAEYLVRRGAPRDLFVCVRYRDDLLLLLESISFVWGGVNFIQTVVEEAQSGRISFDSDTLNYAYDLIPKKSAWSFFNPFQ